MAFTAIAKRSETVWLVTEEDLEGDPDTLPERARVLDLDQRKLFPPYNTHSILARGHWWSLEPEERPDVEEMLEGVEKLDERARDDAHDPGATPGARP